MLLTRISFIQIPICWLYHPRFVVGSPRIYYRLVFGKPKAYQPRRARGLPSLPRNETKLGRNPLLLAMARSYCGVSTIEVPPADITVLPIIASFATTQVRPRGQGWNAKVWRPMHPPKKRKYVHPKIRWKDGTSFPSIWSSSAPFSHFKSESHFCSPHV